MTAIIVTGLINIETTLKIDHFPVDYAAVRYPFFEVNSTVSGVGYNVAKALTTLGDSVTFGSMIGNDLAGLTVRTTLAQDGIVDDAILTLIDQTPQSVILYDSQGQRSINVDLKDIQEQSYPTDRFKQMISTTKVASLCNVNFSRSFLKLAKDAGVLVATDVHTISNLDDEYNRDFMQYADVLFMSHEHLPCSPEEWARAVQGRFGCEIVVIGMGSGGALLAVKSEQFMKRYPAIHTRPIVNTIGAGDALFSAFLHFYVKEESPHIALRKAMVFASYKIGERGAASGFLLESKLNDMSAKIL